MSTRIASDSVEYLRVPYATLDSSGVAADPTGATVEVGFSSADDTEPTTWNTASWETSESIRLRVGATSVDTAYKAKLLIGPGTTAGELDAGIHHVWVKVSDSPETPIVYGGHITVI